MGIHHDQIVNVRHSTTRRRKPEALVPLKPTVLDLLQTSLEVNVPRSNGLRLLSGIWSDAQHRKFLERTASLEEIDPEIWK